MQTSPKNRLPDPTVDMSFTSNALPTFIAKVKNQSRANVLDLGPVCNENINIFAHLVKKLYVWDMFAHLARTKKKEGESKPWGQQLHFLPGTFDGILLWDLPDRLTDGDAREAGRRCHDMLKSGGMVLTCAAAETEKNTEVNAFVLQKDFQVIFRTQPHLDFPLHPRNTRDLMGVLAPLKLVQSFLFRNGFRELLFQKK